MQGISSLNSAYVADQASFNTNTVDAAFTGSANTAVLEFAALSTTSPNPGTITENSLAARAASGTIISLGSPGRYHIAYSFVTADAAGNPITGGIAFGATGAITADPVLGTNGVVQAVDFVAGGVASTDCPIQGSAVVLCTAAMVTAGTDTIMILATDGAAGAPAGILVASATVRIVKLADSNA